MRQLACQRRMQTLLVARLAGFVERFHLLAPSGALYLNLRHYGSRKAHTLSFSLSPTPQYQNSCAKLLQCQR